MPSADSFLWIDGDFLHLKKSLISFLKSYFTFNYHFLFNFYKHIQLIKSSKCSSQSFTEVHSLKITYLQLFPVFAAIGLIQYRSPF